MLMPKYSDFKIIVPENAAIDYEYATVVERQMLFFKQEVALCKKKFATYWRYVSTGEMVDDFVALSAAEVLYDVSKKES